MYNFSPAERENISAYLDYCVHGTSDEVAAPLEDILFEWNKGKSEFLFKMFKDELIIEYPYATYEHDWEAEKGSLLNSAFLRELQSRAGNVKVLAKHSSENLYMLHLLERSMELLFQNLELNKVKLPSEFSCFYIILDEPIFSYALEDICDEYGYISEENAIEFLKHHKSFKVTQNTRITKLLSKLCILTHQQERYKEFENTYSLALENKIEGSLCLSIHPLDYLSMSHNGYNWKSCMNFSFASPIDTAGGRKIGTVELMNSPCVITAYLKGKEDFCFDGKHTVSNKKWRQNFFVDAWGIISDKPYPYPMPELTLFIMEELSDMIKETFWFIKFKDKPKLMHTSDPYCPKIAFNVMYPNWETADNVNHGEYYYWYTSRSGNLKYPVFDISAPATCLRCGQEIEEDTEDYTTIVCMDCRNGFVCGECGDWVFYDQVSSEHLLNEGVCESCYTYYLEEDKKNSKLIT